ncbi:MAG: hypothetical protein FJ148_03890 [Deltaproteobacteria bacterium]|nr:hypothetical protein [Deltaproteobacteria bacterium]
MSPSPIRSILTSSTCALDLFASLVGEAAAARSAVSTGNDVVADEGLCSLREGVIAANLNRSSGRAPGECIAGVRSRPCVIVLRRSVTIA